MVLCHAHHFREVCSAKCKSRFGRASLSLTGGGLVRMGGAQAASGPRRIAPLLRRLAAGRRARDQAGGRDRVAGSGIALCCTAGSASKSSPGAGAISACPSACVP